MEVGEGGCKGRMLNKCLGKLQEWSNSWYSASNFLQASNLNASLLIVLRGFYFYFYCWKEEFMILISSQVAWRITHYFQLREVYK